MTTGRLKYPTEIRSDLGTVLDRYGLFFWLRNSGSFQLTPDPAEGQGANKYLEARKQVLKENATDNEKITILVAKLKLLGFEVEGWP